MTFERSTDYELIRQIVTHPQIYPHVSDDGSPAAEDYKPIESDALWYIVVRDGDEVLGLWMLHPQNFVTYEVHTCLLPCAWGARAGKAAQEVIAWIWANVPCKRLVTNVPECNRLALRFAKQAGFIEYGFNPDSFQKDGKLYGQHLLGLTKPGETSCH